MSKKEPIRCLWCAVELSIKELRENNCFCFVCEDDKRQKAKIQREREESE